MYKGVDKWITLTLRARTGLPHDRRGMLRQGVWCGAQTIRAIAVMCYTAGVTLAAGCGTAGGRYFYRRRRDYGIPGVPDRRGSIAWRGSFLAGHCVSFMPPCERGAYGFAPLPDYRPDKAAGHVSAVLARAPSGACRAMF